MICHPYSFILQPLNLYTFTKCLINLYLEFRFSQGSGYPNFQTGIHQQTRNFPIVLTLVFKEIFK